MDEKSSKRWFEPALEYVAVGALAYTVLRVVTGDLVWWISIPLSLAAAAGAGFVLSATRPLFERKK